MEIAMTPEEQAAADKAAADAAKNQKVEFSTEQQALINNIFDKRFGKIEAKHNEEKTALATENEALKAQLAELTAGKGGKKDGEKDGKGEPDARKLEYEGLLNNEKGQTKAAKELLAKREEENKSLAAENLRIRKDIAMRAAAGNRFIDMEAVQAMTNSAIEFDDDTKTFVVRENGVVRQNSSLQNMTLEEYFDEFAKKRPYLVSADVVGGAGSKPNTGGTSQLGVIRTKADLKDRRSKIDYVDKFGLEAYEKLPLR